MKQATYYLGVERPTTLRRNVLESAKLSVAILRSQYHLKELRDRKFKETKELANLLQELSLLLDRLEQELPTHSLKDMPPHIKRKMQGFEAETPERKPKPPMKVPKASRSKKSVGKPPIPASKKKSANRSINELEGQLSNIEHKLNQLR